MSASPTAAAAPASTGLRADALSRGHEIAVRYPELMRPDLRRRVEVVAIVATVLALFVYGIISLDISWRAVWAGIGRLGEFVALMLPPSYGTTAKLVHYLQGLAATLAIAFLGTLLAAVLAVPLGFLAARNVIPNFLVHFAVRRVNDTLRAIDTLIWALIWINVVGLGAFAGILAIMTEDLGIFGKLYSEAIEAADAKPVEGVISTGGGPLHAVRFGIVPQVLPVLLSQVLYYFESNTRSATIIGIVGAGGIGANLYEEIQQNEWPQVAFLVLIILLTVALIDFISSRLRAALIGTPRSEP
jgi:phosphonate transport system permease protein